MRITNHPHIHKNDLSVKKASIFEEKKAMFPFEKLEVYKIAFNTNKVVYNYLKGNKDVPAYVKNQLGRATFSVMLNIVEGSAKFTNKDRKNFYVIARGSVYECASITSFLFHAGDMRPNVNEELNAGFESISKMLYAMINNLDAK